MTYAVASALQTAIWQRLSGDAELVALVGAEIHDAPPQGGTADAPDLMVTLGEERVRDNSTKTSRGASHDFTVDVVARTEGFSRPKAAAAAVCEALLGADLTLSKGHLVDLRFLSARAERGRASAPRRVSLRFRAVIEETS
ncbi:MAG: DUF3168 domain-containing protein [Pseudomonadota bacterium]